MRKYCIISYCNIYVLPYAKTYINAIEENGSECTLMFWDRDANNGERDAQSQNCQYLLYQKKVTPETSILEKIKGYSEATKYFKKMLKNIDFDGVILLQSHAAVACASVLINKYSGRYIVDIRDYAFENIGIYRYEEQRVLNHSFKNIISSSAYKKFLPQGEYIVAHNYSPFEQSIVDSVRQKGKTNRIEISFIGTIRFLDMDHKILKLFGNDDRFQINYYGTGSDVLKKFCENESISNADFIGSFSPNDLPDLYKATSLINNLYGNHDKFLDYALSNKLYHAAQFYIPILVCPDTYMAEITNAYNLGFIVDVDDPHTPDRLYEQFMSFDMEKFISGCNNFIAKVKIENEIFHKEIMKFLERN